MTELSKALLSEIIPANSRNIFVAYSGGVDSQVLLHLCAADARYHDRLTAVYVHHGLQQEADAWTEHCRYSAEELGVAFRELRVDAGPNKRQSPEEGARIARYSALQQLLDKDDVLLVAQHREDQLETVLLQLFRGAGVAGLAAMPEIMAFGEGMLLRPLLTVGKDKVLRYAAQHRLEWVEDPSNRSSDYDRNYLRNEIIPSLKQRWPSLDKTVARSARHCAGAAAVLRELADELLDGCCDAADKTLLIDRLLALENSKRSLVLRRWFEWQGLKAPGETVLQTVIEEIVGAGTGADPELRSQAHLIKRYRGKLYCLDRRELVRDQLQQWPQGVGQIRRNNGYHLELVGSSSGIPVRLWQESDVTVRLRQGGEHIKLPGREGRHALKKLFQAAAIPPWQRDLIPLIYFADRLAAVAGIWVAEEFFCAGGEPCFRILWRKE